MSKILISEKDGGDNKGVLVVGIIKLKYTDV